jgi:hypothetical protein
MLVLLLAMLAWTSSAETHTDAATLLREVAEAANSAQSWHIEGSIEESGTHTTASFTLVMRSNNQTRF